MELIETLGKCFRTPTGIEYGVIRSALQPYPMEIRALEVIGEDDCGNYFLLLDNAIAFWDHETSETTILAGTKEVFIAGCSEPEIVELGSGQVSSVWIDPDFAEEFGLKTDL